MDLSWLDELGGASMNPKKIEIMRGLVEESKGKAMNQTLPIIMKAGKKLKEENLSFTPEETAMLMSVLTKDMSEEEKKKVEAMKEIVNKNSK